MLEKDIEKAVKRYAESKGWLTRKWTSPNHIGVPDQIFISPVGKIVFIEFKRDGGKATPMQLREHEKLRAHGCTVVVIDNVDDGKRVVDENS